MPAKFNSRSRSMSDGDSSGDDGHNDDEKVTNSTALERIYQEALQSAENTIKGLRDHYHKVIEELRGQNTKFKESGAHSTNRVAKLEQRYQQALEYNNSVSSENEDLNTELKKVKAQLAAAQATIKALKAQITVKKKKGKTAKTAKKNKKAAVKRERSSSSSSSRSRSKRRNKRSRSRSRRRRSSRGSRRDRSSSSSNNSSPKKAKRSKAKAPPPPTRNPAKEKAFTFKPGSLGVKCKGVLVHEVTAGAQAEGLGIKTGWRLVEVNDVTVNNTTVRKQLKDAILSKAPFTITFNAGEE